MSFLEELNTVQRHAVEAVDGPVMIVAGAGSGKTRVLTYRTAHLLQKGVRPESVLALTFTNKAADEMKSRIAELVGPASRALWMGTFHSLLARMLRFECEALGYSRNFSIYDSDESLSLIKGIMNDLGVSQQQFTPSGIRSRISNAKNSMVAPAELQRRAVDIQSTRTADIFVEYEARLKRANAMDFDDLLLKPLELFRAHKDVLKRYQQRFQYIQVDEYQDTNRVQYLLLHELAAGHKNICIVGDDAQSIYSFRGADIRNILDFQKDYPECKVFRLEQNYRSTKTILGAADSLIRHNVDQIKKTLWTSNADGDQVVVDVCDDDREEGRRIVAHVEEEVRHRKRALSDFAILYRTNAQSRVLEDALRRNGIPYVIIGGVAFYKRKEIKDVLAYLKLLANPKDDESLLRIINVPARAIGDTTIKRIRSVAASERITMLDALAAKGLEGLLQDRALRAVRQFHAMLVKYIGLKGQMSLSELARALVDETGILRILKEENTPDATARRDNILELISAITEYADTHDGAVLEDFLQEVSLVSDVDTAEFGRNAVTLMTLHAAKGLEFPVVFISGLEEGLLPISLSLDTREQVEEERRLMYVGMTRARQQLYISHARSRYHQGEVMFSVRSRFVEEIDPLHLTFRGGAAGASDSPLSAPARPRTAARPSAWRAPVKPVGKSAGSSDPMPRYEDESQEQIHLHVGLAVTHETFGQGRIVALDGSGSQARAVVDFKSVGRKQLLLKFANLRAGA
ncbi:MAG: UvrD-helicase domain-containing protein [Ignavibacteriae bacterium]|nr:UvrD-helicase domain-containing protein [Ignavibacteriota bacterium]